MYAENNSVNWIDPKGLAIWSCSRKAHLPAGNHAYFWDDRYNMCCGRGSRYGCIEKGPKGGDYCNIIPGSAGREDELMTCCKETADKGLWAPPVNDCHEALDDCLRDSGLPSPGAPGGRTGEPCDPPCSPQHIPIPPKPKQSPIPPSWNI